MYIYSSSRTRSGAKSFAGFILYRSIVLIALSRHHHESHDIYSRRNKTNFLQHAWSSPLHFHPSLNSQFSFELNLQFNLLCRIFSWYSSLLFSFLFFYSISVVKIIGKRIIIEKCKELSEIGLNRQNTQQCTMCFFQPFRYERFISEEREIDAWKRVESSDLDVE